MHLRYKISRESLKENIFVSGRFKKIKQLYRNNYGMKKIHELSTILSPKAWKVQVIKCKGQSCAVLLCCREEARKQDEQWTHAVCYASFLPVYL